MLSSATETFLYLNASPLTAASACLKRKQVFACNTPSKRSLQCRLGIVRIYRVSETRLKDMIDSLIIFLTFTITISFHISSTDPRRHPTRKVINGRTRTVQLEKKELTTTTILSLQKNSWCLLNTTISFLRYQLKTATYSGPWPTRVRKTIKVPHHEKETNLNTCMNMDQISRKT